MRYVIAFVALIIAVGYVGHDDYQEAERQEKLYCEMVKQWKNNPNTGWPPFRSDIDCK